MERQVASRYAEAVFSLAQEKKEVDQVGEDLKTVVQLVEELPDLAKVLEHPEVGEHRKYQLIDRAFAGRVSPTTIAFLKTLVQRNRSELLPYVLAEYQLLVDRSRGIERVQVDTAAPLSPEQESRLRAALEKLTGKNIIFETQVVPELLAGLRVQVNSRMIDGSAAGRLEAMRAKLKEVGTG